MTGLYFRADMNETIATGHVMRCLSIADAAKELGIRSTFLLADENACDLITRRGHEYKVLNSQWNHPETELSAMRELIGREGIEKLIVDSYSVTESYLSELSGLTEVTYIDDINAFHYPVQGLICYAPYYRNFGYGSKYVWDKMYLGCRYVPLRKDFMNLSQKKISKQVENILLLSGGSDHYHILSGITDLLEEKKKYKLDVVCGRYNDDYQSLIQRYEGNDSVRIHKTVDTLLPLMQKADLAISAGGSTLYELCACKTPTITYYFADNQIENVRAFERDEVMYLAGDARNTCFLSRLEHILSEYESYEFRKGLSLRMNHYVDGRGALRIVREMFRE